MPKKKQDSQVKEIGELEVIKGISRAKLRKITQVVFREILPKYPKFKIREQQIALAEELLDALTGRKTLLAEAPTGLGKTLTYIIVSALVRRSGIGKTFSGSYYPEMNYVEYCRMGVLVSTSSIALQKAIHFEVIPELSEIFMEHGIIREPLTSILRKGKEHYVCECNLVEYLPCESDSETHKTLKRIALNNKIFDINALDCLSAHVKSKISVPSRCYSGCPSYKKCRYYAFRETAKNTDYDFTVTNHQLLLADMKMRGDDSGSILPPFSTLILDEAHRFLPAARSLYGAELSIEVIPAVSQALLELNFTPKYGRPSDGWKTRRDTVCRLAQKLHMVHKRLFSRSNVGERCDKSLKNISNIADLAHHYLSKSYIFKVERDERLKYRLLWDLKQISKTADELADSNSMIRWFVTENDKEDDTEVRTAIGGIPKNLNQRLYSDLWSRRIPAFLTSGTLSVNGDFTALKQTLGLDNKNVRLMEVTHNSPFNYKENCLMYLSDSVVDYRSEDYITQLTNEIERLIKAANGHAAVLFTSYRSMRSVHARLKRRLTDKETFMLERSSSSVIEQFKASGNGVMFACGSMWEGIDCPGDILSLLIIAKLPFAQPDAISEYEQTRYSTFDEYFNAVLIPDMFIKLKQGFGRLIRTENDSGVVAILDSRANSKGVYRDRVLNALPDCPVTNQINKVEDFYKAKKSPDFFK